MGYIKDNSNQDSFNEKAIYTILVASTIVFGGYGLKLLGYFIETSNTSILAYNTTIDLVYFIRLTHLVIIILGTISSLLSYKVSKVKEVYFMFLIYLIYSLDSGFAIFMDQLGVFMNDQSINESLNSNIYMGYGMSTIRITLGILMACSKTKVVKYILRNQNKFTLFIITIAILLSCIEYTNPNLYGVNVIHNHMIYNLLSSLIYGIISVIFVTKAIKSKIYMNAVIASTMMMFFIQGIDQISSKFNAGTNARITSVSIIYIGSSIIIFAIFIELIKSNRMNNKLKNELDLFYLVVNDNIIHNIFVFDENKYLVYANDKSKEFLIKNKNINYSPDDRQSVHLDMLLNNSNNGKGNYDKVYEGVANLRKYIGTLEDENRIYDVMAQKIYKDNKSYTVILSRDITKEESMRRDSIELEKVKEREIVRNEFFANISHELKTPLNIIYSTTQLLSLKSSSDDFKDIYLKHSKSIGVNCQRMLRLINNIVDITKLDVGYKKAEFKNYDIVRLVEGITLSVISYARRKKVNLLFDTDIEELVIRCDAEMIERVMLNLLSNAIKFTPKYGDILVYLSCDESFVKILVKDSGIGIPKKSQPFIFERFMQVDKTLKRRNEGSGIGLSIVKSIVDINGGSINVRSDGKSGTEFEVLLPNKKIIETNENSTQRDLDGQNIQLELSDIYELYEEA